MKCAKCRIDNPDAQKFYGECGKKLEKICPNCSFSKAILQKPEKT
jgi:hypothetical protein